nr:MAG TPA: hypothetical protein [Caudoviricetes sp.]
MAYMLSHSPKLISGVPFSRKAYNPSRVIGERSVVGVGLGGVDLVKVVVLKLFGFLDLRDRADRHQSQSGAGCKYSGSSNELGSIPLDSGNESVLVELELDDLVVGLDGVVCVHGGSFRVEGSHIRVSFLRESLYPKLMGHGGRLELGVDGVLCHLFFALSLVQLFL